MRVSDIFTEAQNIVPYADTATLFSRISDAVEAISNKGLIDAMQGYLEIPVTSSRIVTLPRDIETPVKVNISDNPSFSRTKLFEFALNGPGSNYSPTTWSWEDRGGVPVLQQPATPTTVKAVSSAAGDTTTKIYVSGRVAPVAPETLGKEVTETITLAGTAYSTAVSPNTFVTITKVLKDSTSGTVTLATASGTPLAIYAPDETEPFYKQIRLNKSGTTAHILYRRSVYRISTLNDFIPIQSRMGLFLMLRANEIYRKSTAGQDVQTAQLLEKQAQAFVEEEQKSRNVFAEVSAQTEKDEFYGLNINNRDSIIVSDIYDDIAKIVGPIGQPNLFDKITDALELLTNKGQWDGLEGYVDIVTSDTLVTLPRYVDFPLAINIGKSPTRMHNRWHEFHLNGPGSTCREFCDNWTDKGDVVTISDLPSAQGLIYKPDSAGDNGKTITIYGYDANDLSVTLTLTGSNTNAFANISAQTINRIDRITRDATTGYAQLIAYTSDGLTSTQLGYYAPDETEPNYRRIKIPVNAPWVRVRYRKRSLKIASLTDPLHLRSRLAIVTAVASIQAMMSEKPDLQASEALEKKALQYLSEEKSARNPAGTWSIQFDPKTSMASPEHYAY